MTDTTEAPDRANASSQDMTTALVQRKLAWEELLGLMRAPKEPSRFDETIVAHQQLVDWDEQILLPLGENLYIVAKDGRAIVKTRVGAELGPWDGNWKMQCRVIVRRTRADLLEIYPEDQLTIDSDLIEIREFLCPISGTVLDVDCVPPTYPVEVDFTPDLAAFYRDWLGRELPVAV
ncbi:acetone carboxylase subunit gamma [Streptomyces sp.]|uniref:acetone carboxylase subunit gamma n=1 Tax=Streptomyces sp. TaxID=1931 RepID=UPI002D794E1E|nr:acetone carboxylase subunit gamma [Streptomyces sp.]HET6356625.1 acetone carboxylase subunit gamma [Streptomyces sp.]